MSQISAAAVKELRDRTNLSMMECKNALVQADGNVEKAIEIIKARMGSKFTAGAAREAAEGRIATFIDPVKKLAAIVELRCETAPVAKAEAFVALGRDLAEQIARQAPATPEALLKQPWLTDGKKTVMDRLTDAYALLRENMKVARFARLEGVCGDYVHHDATLGVLLQVTGEPKSPEVLRDVCMHIAAYLPTPIATHREDVPADLVAKEYEAAKAKAAASGKPAAIVEKIADGQMKTWYGQTVLIEQPFIKDDSQTVGQVLKSAGVEAVRFIRYKIGEISG